MFPPRSLMEDPMPFTAIDSAEGLKGVPMCQTLCGISFVAVRRTHRWQGDPEGNTFYWRTPFFDKERCDQLGQDIEAKYGAGLRLYARHESGGYRVYADHDKMKILSERAKTLGTGLDR